MVYCMYAFLQPDVVLDTRILQKIWPHAARLRRFYHKFEEIECGEDDGANAGAFDAVGDDVFEVN